MERLSIDCNNLSAVESPETLRYRRTAEASATSRPPEISAPRMDLRSPPGFVIPSTGLRRGYSCGVSSTSVAPLNIDERTYIPLYHPPPHLVAELQRSGAVLHTTGDGSASERPVKRTRDAEPKEREKPSGSAASSAPTVPRGARPEETKSTRVDSGASPESGTLRVDLQQLDVDFRKMRQAMQTILEKLDGHGCNHREEMNEIRTKMRDFMSQMSAVEARHAKLAQRIDSLEAQIARNDVRLANALETVGLVQVVHDNLASLEQTNSRLTEELDRMRQEMATLQSQSEVPHAPVAAAPVAPAAPAPLPTLTTAPAPAPNAAPPAAVAPAHTTPAPPFSFSGTLPEKEQTTLVPKADNAPTAVVTPFGGGSAEGSAGHASSTSVFSKTAPISGDQKPAASSSSFSLNGSAGLATGAPASVTPFLFGGATTAPTTATAASGTSGSVGGTFSFSSATTTSNSPFGTGVPTPVTGFSFGRGGGTTGGTSASSGGFGSLAGASAAPPSGIAAFGSGGAGQAATAPSAAGSNPFSFSAPAASAMGTSSAGVAAAAPAVGFGGAGGPTMGGNAPFNFGGTSSAAPKQTFSASLLGSTENSRRRIKRSY